MLFRLRSSPLFLILGFVLVFVVIWSVLDDARSRALGWENKPAGELTLQSPDGRTINLSDYKGKVVMIDFWATWCGPCKQSIPGIVGFYAKYRSRGFQVIGPALERDGGVQIPSAIQDLGMQYPVGLPTKTEQIESYLGTEGVGIPYMVLIDKRGVIRWHQQGYNPGGESEIEQRIESLLAE